MVPVAMEAFGKGRMGARLGTGGWGIRNLDSFQPGMGPECSLRGVGALRRGILIRRRRKSEEAEVEALR